MFKFILGVARINFLTLTIACIVLAQSYSVFLGYPFDIRLFTLVLVMALFAHISVNAFNEYFDFRSGLDFLTPKTPFSGGSGRLIENPSGERIALALAILSLILVVFIGLVLVMKFGSVLLWIGVPGVLIIYTYTQYLNRSPLLCLLAPGVGFGLLMTLGASWLFLGAHETRIPLGAWLLALMVTALVSNLLLVNQLPDIEADKKVGRRHLPIVLGRRSSVLIALGLHVLALGLLILGVMLGELPRLLMFAALSGLLLFKFMPGLYHLSEQWQLKAAVPLLAVNIIFIHLLIIVSALLLFLA